MDQNGDGKFPYFPMYPTDFLADDKVQLMKPCQRGFYALLLFHAWVQNPPGTLPCDDQILSKLLGLSLKQWLKERDAVLNPFHYDLDDDRWHQKRMELEYQKILGRSEKAKKSANMRWHCERNASSIAASNARAFGSGSDSGSSSEEGNGEKPPGRDPNGPPLPRRANPIDRRNPPFQLGGVFDNYDFKLAVKNGWLKYAEESLGKLYTGLEFSVLMNDLQREFKGPQAAIEAISKAIRCKYRNILFPSETGENCR